MYQVKYFDPRFIRLQDLAVRPIEFDAVAVIGNVAPRNHQRRDMFAKRPQRERAAELRAQRSARP